jgi:hypothetical protein
MNSEGIERTKYAADNLPNFLFTIVTQKTRSFSKNAANSGT